MQRTTRKTMLAAVGLVSAATAVVACTRRKHLSLKGAVVLITGGSRGLGLEIARACGRKGANLLLVARDGEELDRARSSLVSCKIAEERVSTFACDITQPASVDELQAFTRRTFGKVDVLVNDAGIIMVGPALSFAVADYQRAMQTNFFGALRVTTAILPQMIDRRAGSIVNIASIGGKVAFPHLLPYVASKFALEGWSHGLRTELAPYGIRVTTVNPGVLKTGSHIQAYFSGHAQEEYQWFGSSASQMATATQATKAAYAVMRALERGSAEVQIGVDAILAAHLADIAPSLTRSALSAINTVLPAGPDSMNRDSSTDQLTQGSHFRGDLAPIFEHGSESAIHAYNEDAASRR